MIQYSQHRAILLLTVTAIVCLGCRGESIVSTDAGAGEHAVAAGAYTDDPLKFGRADGAVTVPFKATFFTTGVLMPDEERCGAAPPFLLNTQDGDGQATHLGNFSIHITFCVDVTDLLNDPGDDGEPLTEGESVPYFDGIGTFTAANGDLLRFTIAGAVLPSDHPDYDFEFADPFEFTGGTGRFQGATGMGVTNSFVDFEAGRTDHQWSGMLTLQKGM